MINHFTGNYRFLSNFYPCDIKYEGLWFPSVEHAYVAAKTNSKTERLEIACINKAGEVKRYGRILKLRDDWDSIKLVVMELLLRQKFEESRLRQLLIETGEEELVEGNYWHDLVWGKCTCKTHNCEGENHLGKLLMKIRSEILNVR